MVLVVYENTENGLRVWEKLDWITCHSDCEHVHQRLITVIH